MHARPRRIIFIVALLATMVTPLVLAAGAEAMTPLFADPTFQHTWGYTDMPTVTGQADRTLMWGSYPFTSAMMEPYKESPGGKRLVQYFDKARMEITNPAADKTSQWYVTNGLLAKEMVTGMMQLGNNTYLSAPPAQVNVAGDLDDPNGPTYASFNKVPGYKAIPSGWAVTQTINRAGAVGNNPNMRQYNVSALDVGAPTHHTVASVFWAFMNSSGPVWQWQSDQIVQNQRLFPNAYYATGYPLTEPYWTSVLLGGKQTDVLVQVFERRVMTYTPSNKAGWQVEAGNVGLQYYTWRYTDLKQPKDVIGSKG